jgi:hypothetical protein
MDKAHSLAAIREDAAGLSPLYLERVNGKENAVAPAISRSGGSTGRASSKDARIVA